MEFSACQSAYIPSELKACQHHNCNVLLGRFLCKLSSNCKYFSYNPFDGPNENPEAELPLTAGEYIYIYGDMDEDGFFEGVF